MEKFSSHIIPYGLFFGTINCNEWIYYTGNGFIIFELKLLISCVKDNSVPRKEKKSECIGTHSQSSFHLQGAHCVLVTIFSVHKI